jgi:hypothetical protein
MGRPAVQEKKNNAPGAGREMRHRGGAIRRGERRSRPEQTREAQYPEAGAHALEHLAPG